MKLEQRIMGGIANFVIRYHKVILIAAIVLLRFGTGPIKGFAVTLSLGIVASLFTAIFVTRIIFDYFLLVRKVSRIRI